MRTHRLDFLFHSLITPRIDGSIFINTYSNRCRGEPSSTSSIDVRAISWRAQFVKQRQENGPLHLVEVARLREINVTLYDTRARNSFPIHDITLSYVRSKTRGPRLRTSRWIERRDREMSPQGCLKLESWPVSRKKAAPHWPLVVVVVDVVEIGRIRETAILVTGAP